MVAKGGSWEAWPPAAIDDLRVMHRDGLSYRAIANALNSKYQTQYSRNAICGKIHRLNLSRAIAPRAPSLKHPGNRMGGAARLAAVKAVTQAAQAAPEPAGYGRRLEGPTALTIIAAAKLKAAPPPAAKGFDPLPGSTPRPWIEREPGQCCWPVGEPREAGDQLSCCEPVASVARPYCRAHAKARLAHAQTGKTHQMSEANRARAGARMREHMAQVGARQRGWWPR